MYNKRRFQDLTIRDNFIFAAVMMQDDNCKRFLEMLLGIEIREVVISYEKSLIYNPEYKDVRLDVYANDENNTGTDDAYVKKLQDTIRSVKENREMERSFMTWEDIRRESKAEGKQEDVLELLEELGKVSDVLQDRIMSEGRLDVLKLMLKAASKASSIEEFEKQISNL